MPLVIRWERLGELRSPVLMLAAAVFIAVGIFMIYVPAGWISVGVMVAVVAYLWDQPAAGQGQAEYRGGPGR